MVFVQGKDQVTQTGWEQLTEEQRESFRDLWRHQAEVARKREAQWQAKWEAWIWGHPWDREPAQRSAQRTAGERRIVGRELQTIAPEPHQMDVERDIDQRLKRGLEKLRQSPQ
jgi:hypothetical protein